MIDTNELLWWERAAEQHTALDENRKILRLIADLRAARAALEPFAFFARQFDSKPLGNMADTVYAIHTGTPYAAELRLQDMRRAARITPSATPVEVKSEVDDVSR